MLADGAKWLGSQMKQFAGHEVTYTRGSDSITILATVGTSTHQTIDGKNGSLIKIKSRDFIVTAADLDFGSGPFKPERDDEITETIDGVEYRFRVMPFGQDPCYRFSDNHGVRFRIHTKGVQ